MARVETRSSCGLGLSGVRMVTSASPKEKQIEIFRL